MQRRHLTAWSRRTRTPWPCGGTPVPGRPAARQAIGAGSIAQLNFRPGAFGPVAATRRAGQSATARRQCQHRREPGGLLPEHHATASAGTASRRLSACSRRFAAPGASAPAGRPSGSPSALPPTVSTTISSLLVPALALFGAAKVDRRTALRGQQSVTSSRYWAVWGSRRDRRGEDGDRRLPLVLTGSVPARPRSSSHARAMAGNAGCAVLINELGRGRRITIWSNGSMETLVVFDSGCICCEACRAWWRPSSACLSRPSARDPAHDFGCHGDHRARRSGAGDPHADGRALHLRAFPLRWRDHRGRRQPRDGAARRTPRGGAPGGDGRSPADHQVRPCRRPLLAALCQRLEHSTPARSSSKSRAAWLRPTPSSAAVSTTPPARRPT